MSTPPIRNDAAIDESDLLPNPATVKFRFALPAAAEEANDFCLPASLRNFFSDQVIDQGADAPGAGVF
mgnify:CR=1 FL=1